MYKYSSLRAPNVYVNPNHQSNALNSTDMVHYQNKYFNSNSEDLEFESNMSFNDNIDKYKIKDKSSEEIQKELSENTISRTKISYVNIDSRKRNKYPVNEYKPEIINLKPFPLEFTNNSSIIKIHLNDDNHTFNLNDQIVLNNVISKNLLLKNVVMVKKNSMFVLSLKNTLLFFFLKKMMMFRHRCKII